MKKLLLNLLLFSAPLLSRAQAPDTSNLVKTGDIAPTFTFSIDKDKTADIKDYRGKIVMKDFFATWCPPCRQELPRIQKEIWEKYKNNPKFALFAFDRQEDWDKVLPFKEKNQFTFLMLPDADRKIFALYANQYIPRVILLDENGRVIYQSMGYVETDFTELLNVLAKKLP